MSSEYKKNSGSSSGECPPMEDGSESASLLWGAFSFHFSPWKQAQMCNVINVSASLQFNMSQNIMSNNSVYESNSIYVSASCDRDNPCDEFNFNNNEITSVNTIDMNNVQMAYVSNMAQGILYQGLQAYTSIVTKYLNMFPLALSATSQEILDEGDLGNYYNVNMTNIINTFIRVGCSINTNISQTCSINQQNTINLTVKNYNEVDISGNLIDQENDATMSCTQTAYLGNAPVSEMVNNLSNISSVNHTLGGPSRNGIGRRSLTTVIVSAVVGCVVLFAFMLMLYYVFRSAPSNNSGSGDSSSSNNSGIISVNPNESKSSSTGMMVFFIGLCALVGVLLIAMYYTVQPIASAWFGFSPGIMNTQQPQVKSLYSVALQKNYNDVSDAVMDFDNNESYVAMDYDPDMDAIEEFVQSSYRDAPSELKIPGTATFYTGSIENFDQCYEITNPGISPLVMVDEKVKTESGGNDSGKVPIITYRNPYYRNASLAGKDPPNELDGDVLLDVDTGRMFFKMPAGSYSSSDKATRWFEPSIINTKAPNQHDNVFQSLDPTESESANNNKAKAYFYIDVDHTMLYDGKLYPLPPTGKTYTNPIDRDSAAPFRIDDGPVDESASYYSIKTTVKNGDYFVVPYPIGMSDQNTRERYQYSQAYFVYKAVLNETTGEWEPAWGPSKYDNPSGVVNGYGLVPIVQPFKVTRMKYHQQHDALFIVGLTVICTSVAMLIALGAFRYFNSASSAN